MRRYLSLLVATGAIALAPAISMAAPPSGQSNNGSKSGTAATPNSPNGNGGGYNHSNSPSATTGQPNQSCEASGNTPGNSAGAPGSPFNPSGNAGTKYAGTQPQNSRNSNSNSQYDVACSNQPH
jgi:hypothetical protein